MLQTVAIIVLFVLSLFLGAVVLGLVQWMRAATVGLRQARDCIMTQRHDIEKLQKSIRDLHQEHP